MNYNTALFNFSHPRCAPYMSHGMNMYPSVAAPSPSPIYCLPSGFVVGVHPPSPPPRALEMHGTVYFLENQPHCSAAEFNAMEHNGTTYFPQLVDVERVPGSYVKNGTTFFVQPTSPGSLASRAPSWASTPFESSRAATPELSSDAETDSSGDVSVSSMPSTMENSPEQGVIALPKDDLDLCTYVDAHVAIV